MTADEEHVGWREREIFWGMLAETWWELCERLSCMCSFIFSKCRDLRIGEAWEDLAALTTRVREFWIAKIVAGVNYSSQVQTEQWSDDTGGFEFWCQGVGRYSKVGWCDNSKI